MAAVRIAPPLGLRLTPAASLALLLPYSLASSVRVPTSGTIALSLPPSARGPMMAAPVVRSAVGEEPGP